MATVKRRSIRIKRRKEDGNTLIRQLLGNPDILRIIDDYGVSNKPLLNLAASSRTLRKTIVSSRSTALRKVTRIPDPHIFMIAPQLLHLDITGVKVPDLETWRGTLALLPNKLQTLRLATRPDIDAAWLQVFIDYCSMLNNLILFSWEGPIQSMDADAAIDTTPLLNNIQLGGEERLSIALSFLPPYSLDVALLNQPFLDKITLQAMPEDSYLRVRRRRDHFWVSCEWTVSFLYSPGDTRGPWAVDTVWDAAQIFYLTHAKRWPTAAEFKELMGDHGSLRDMSRRARWILAHEELNFAAVPPYEEDRLYSVEHVAFYQYAQPEWD